MFFKSSSEEHCPVTFLNIGQYLRAILESTTRRPSTIYTLTSPSTVKALTFLHAILLLNNSIVTKILSYSRTYLMRTLIEYTMPKIMKVLIAHVHSARMRPFSIIAFFYLMFNWHKIDLSYFQPRKMTLLQDCIPLISQ